MLCAADRFCQQNCSRRDFTGKPVRIADLQGWVCSEAGEKGWVKLGVHASGLKVAVIGGGPAGLSCAYYLTRTGCQVTVFDEEERPGGKLRKISDSNQRMVSAVENDIQGMLSAGINYAVSQASKENPDLEKLQEKYHAIYLPEAGLENCSEVYSACFGKNWRSTLNQKTGQVVGHPQIFVGNEFLMNGISVVEGVVGGREAAMNIWYYLNSQL